MSNEVAEPKTSSEIVKVDEAKLAEIMSSSSEIVVFSENFIVQSPQYSVVFTLLAWDRQRVEELKESLKRVEDAANKLVIENDFDYELAWQLRQDFTERLDFYKLMFKGSKQLAKAAHSSACDLEKVFLSPYQTADEIVEGKRLEYAAKRKEEDDEKRRIEQKKAEEQQRKELDAEAVRLERGGDPEAANEVREIAKNAPAPSVAPSAPLKTTGAVAKINWLFRIVNAAIVPRQYCSPDEKLIRPVVTALGNRANIPGVEAYPQASESVRRGKK